MKKLQFKFPMERTDYIEKREDIISTGEMGLHNSKHSKNIRSFPVFAKLERI